MLHKHLGADSGGLHIGVPGPDRSLFVRLKKSLLFQEHIGADIVINLQMTVIAQDHEGGVLKQPLFL